MRFECKSIAADRISCDFIQIRMLHKVKPDVGVEIKKRLAQWEKEGTDSEEAASLCETTAMFGDYITGKKPKAITDHEAYVPFRDRSARDQKFLVDMNQATLELCKNRNMASAEKLVRLHVERESKTCEVSAYPFTQTFRRADDGKDGRIVWINDMGPSGPCGVVQLNRFENRKGEVSLWRYVARKAVTNPAADAGLLQCKDLDEAEYGYDWRVDEREVGCDFVDFTLL